MSFHHLKNPTSWRRIAIANWRSPNDPTVYAAIPMDFTEGRAFLDQINQNSPHKITPTHFVAKAVALTLKRFPDLNGIIKWKRVYLRDSIDLFLQVAIMNENEKPDLSGAKIEHCDQKSLQQIAVELVEKSTKIRQKNDPQFNKTFQLVNLIPGFLLGYVMRFLSFLVYNLGLNVGALGLPADPFGSAMVTSVGRFKVPAGFAPLVPVSRVPLIICVGHVTPQPRVVGAQIQIRPVLDLTATFDHRFMDGFTGARMLHYFQDIIENPKQYFSTGIN